MTSPVHDVIKILTSAFRKKFDDFKGIYRLIMCPYYAKPDDKIFCGAFL